MLLFFPPTKHFKLFANCKDDVDGKNWTFCFLFIQRETTHFNQPALNYFIFIYLWTHIYVSIKALTLNQSELSCAVLDAKRFTNWRPSLHSRKCPRCRTIHRKIQLSPLQVFRSLIIHFKLVSKNDLHTFPLFLGVFFGKNQRTRAACCQCWGTRQFVSDFNNK